MYENILIYKNILKFDKTDFNERLEFYIKLQWLECQYRYYSVLSKWLIITITLNRIQTHIYICFKETQI